MLLAGRAVPPADGPRLAAATRADSLSPGPVRQTCLPTRGWLCLTDQASGACHGAVQSAVQVVKLANNQPAHLR